MEAQIKLGPAAIQLGKRRLSILTNAKSFAEPILIFTTLWLAGSLKISRFSWQSRA